MRRPRAADDALAEDAVTPHGPGALTGHPGRPRTAAYADANPKWMQPTAPIPSSDRLEDSFFQATQPPESAEYEDPIAVPRKRGGRLALIALTVVVGGAVGAAAAGWNRARRQAASAVDQRAQDTQLERPSPSAAAPTPVPPPVAAPTPVPPPTAAPVPVPPPAAAPVSPERGIGQAPPRPSARPEGLRRDVPVRNMVWSDRLQRLVPADSPIPPQ